MSREGSRRDRSRQTKNSTTQQRSAKESDIKASAGRNHQVEGGTDSKNKIDWSRLEQDVTEVMRRSRNMYPFRTPTERARGGLSFPDVIQEAIAEQLSGTGMPETHDEAVAEIAAIASRRWRAWTRKVTSQGKSLDRLKPTLSCRDLFEVVSARDEHIKVITRLYEAFEHDPVAKQVIYAILKGGFKYHETKQIAAEVGTTDTYVKNLKRRLERCAEKIAKELTATLDKGGEA